MSTGQTVYCGSGKKMKDDWFTITINPDKLKDYIEEFNGNRFIRLNVNVKSEPDQYGKDVSVSVNQYKPDKDVVHTPTPQMNGDMANEFNNSQSKAEGDLPF